MQADNVKYSEEELDQINRVRFMVDNLAQNGLVGAVRRPSKACVLCNGKGYSGTRNSAKRLCKCVL